MEPLRKLPEDKVKEHSKTNREDYALSGAIFVALLKR